VLLTVLQVIVCADVTAKESLENSQMSQADDCIDVVNPLWVLDSIANYPNFFPTFG
jgi:hypothetical protein